MKGSTKRSKVFISYSWSSPQHEQWVLDLAERLTVDGVIVVLDKWDLKEGQDKYVFMERMVQDKDINKVLVICDKKYQDKADIREGGVGTESQLISKEVYDNTEQEKFIPLIKDFDSEGNPCIPHFMVNRIYVDFSSDEIFEENYQKLVRNLYGKPPLKKPPLGMPPAYVIDDKQILLKTSHKVVQIKNAMFNNKSTQGLIYDYLENFLLSLEDFRLEGGPRDNFDEDVLESIERMLPLRDDFIEFTNVVFKYGDKIDLDGLHSFFEKLISFLFKPEGVTSWTKIDFDNYKFFIHELFLYFIADLLKLGKYNEASFFINSKYFFRYDNSNELRNSGIDIFDSYILSLDGIRNKRLNLRRISLTADLIKQRANCEDINFDHIIETDLILYYITELEGNNFSWFPRCSVYSPRFFSNIELFERMISSQHFNKIKILFKVNNLDELKKKVSVYLERIEEGGRKYSNQWDYNMVPLEQVINLEKISTVE